MGHDHHFLERLTRVNPEHQSIAMSLYRDPELVRRVIAAVSHSAGLPKDDLKGRVALALEDGGDGPHIIVSRTGRFITCLAEGMSVGAIPVLSRAMLDADVAWVRHARECRDRGGDTLLSILNDLLRDDLWPSRAQMEELELFSVFHLVELQDALAKLRPAYNKYCNALMGLDRAGRQALDQDNSNEAKLLHHTAVSQRYILHVTTLLAAGTQDSSPLFRARMDAQVRRRAVGLTGIMTPAALLRSAWMIIHCEILPAATLREQLKPDAPYTYEIYLPAVLGRMLNASRVEAITLDRLLAALEDEAAADTARGADERLRYIQLTRWCWAHRDLPLPERARQLAAHPSASVAPWAARFYDPALLEREPERVVQELLACDDHIIYGCDAVTMLLLYAPELARRSISLLYPITPPALTKRERLDRDRAQLRAAHAHQHRTTVVVNTAKQGRNDPCACGSGKKYKKCCGAAEA